MSETPIGLEDVSKYPDLFDKLAEKGHGYEPWTSDELMRLAGRNLLRVFKEVENVRDSLKHEEPYEDLIPYADLIRDNPTQGCRTDVETYKGPDDIVTEPTPVVRYVNPA